MPAVPAFHDVNEEAKPGQQRMHHTNSACAQGQQIAMGERVAGTGGFRRCVDCSRLDEIDALKAAPPSGSTAR